MNSQNLFPYKLKFPDSFSFVSEHIKGIDSIEAFPVLISPEEETVVFDESPERANAWAVYVRYHHDYFKKHNLNPSDWLADFDKEEPARLFAQLANALMKRD